MTTDTIERIVDLDAWETPSDYRGYDPIGHYGVIALTGQSDIIERSNWRVALADMAKAAGIENVPDLADIDNSGWSFNPADAPPVYYWEARHWAAGWVRYLMVKPDASDAIISAAEKIREDIKAYPILDEQDYSELEEEEIASFWKGETVRQRGRLIQEAREKWQSSVSIFAARRDQVPFDEDGGLDQLLRDWVS